MEEDFFRKRKDIGLRKIIQHMVLVRDSRQKKSGATLGVSELT